MSRRPPVPEFDREFWSAVDEGVDRVRALTAAELQRAEAEQLAAEPQGQVVPVFPAPFWARVNKRAAKVREMALDELADAEGRLVDQEPRPGAARRRSGIRLRLPGAASLTLPLRTRVNTLGFVTAVLAALILLPQLVPITSAAGEGRNPLAVFFSSLGDDEPPSAEEAEPGGRASGAGGTGGEGGTGGGGRTSAGNRSGAAAGGDTARNSGSPGTPAAAGATGGAGGAGSDTTGSTGASGAGEAGTTATPEDGASAEAVPAAPSNLLVTAIDDTSVRLRWRDNSSDETGFVIERKGDPASARQTTEANTKTHVWTGLAPGAEACFRVRARNGSGSSDWFPEEYRCVTTHPSQATPGPVALAPLACSEEATLRAGSSLQETRIEFRNQTTQPLKVFALGTEGVRESTPTILEPQASVTIQTFLGHPYVVTRGDEVSPACVAIFRGESWSSVATVPQPAG